MPESQVVNAAQPCKRPSFHLRLWQVHMFFPIAAASVVFVVTACARPPTPTLAPSTTVAPNPHEVETIVAATVYAQLTIAARAIPTTPPPTTLAPTPIPEPTTVPKPAPTPCSILVGSIFSYVSNNQPISLRLGCPLNAAQTSQSAEEAFKGGWMLWRDKAAESDFLDYAIFNDGTFKTFSRLTDAPFTEGVDLEYPCGSPSPPYPRRGFGKIWCNHPEVGSKLGNAIEYEIGYCMPGGGNCEVFQDFSGGMMYHSERVQATFVLFSDGTWTR